MDSVFRVEEKFAVNDKWRAVIPRSMQTKVVGAKHRGDHVCDILAGAPAHSVVAVLIDTDSTLAETHDDWLTRRLCHRRVAGWSWVDLDC